MTFSEMFSSFKCDKKSERNTYKCYIVKLHMVVYVCNRAVIISEFHYTVIFVKKFTIEIYEDSIDFFKI